MRTNLPISLPVSIGCNLSPVNTDSGFVYAAAILIGLYILIIFEVLIYRWGEKIFYFTNFKTCSFSGGS